MGRKSDGTVYFEEKLKQLEDIVSQIEDPNCPIEKAIDLCAKGMTLYAELS
ncbi:MAG: exodeoxyribonuclease VII small subunit, partial [Brevinematales bacterium]